MKNARRLLLAFLVPIAIAAAVFLRPGRHPAKSEPAHPTLAGAPLARGLETSGRTPAESHAIAEALAGFSSRDGAPTLRVATDEDAAPSPERDDLADLYATYHPFFVRGDLNGDGRLDFALAFIEKAPGGWFHVAVFFGREGGGFEERVWVERAVSLGAGDISIERTLLTIVPDLALDEARRWRWEAREGRFVDADASAPPRVDADDAPADEKPRDRI